MEGKYYLRTLGDSILRQSCVEVSDFSDLSDLLSNMYEIMHEKKGVGLAAPQIGDNRRVAIAQIDEEIMEFINPVMLKEGKHPYHPLEYETCLSVPDHYVKLKRKYPIRIGYHDREGEYHTQNFTGFHAVLLQHELDHLNGILITDYPKPKI